MNDYRDRVPPAYADRLDDAIADGVAEIDTSPLEWADVLILRRWYGTVHACEMCDFAAQSEAELQAHAAATGHPMVWRDRIVRWLLSSIENDPAFMRGRAIVYEVDDNLLAAQPWLYFHRRLQGDLDLIERFARRADLVTVSTPQVAAALARYNSNVRVIRNAIAPERYAAPAETSPRPLSFLYYGVGRPLPRLPRVPGRGGCRRPNPSRAAYLAGQR